MIDFRGLDCFTYIDYVEALSTARSEGEFVQRLVDIRYVDGNIAFPQRKHFFTDWAQRPKKWLKTSPPSSARTPSTS